MLYRIVMFSKGGVVWRAKKEAPSHSEAIKTAEGGMAERHALVIGKTAKRFLPSGAEITDIPTLHKIYWRGKHPSIVLMFGKYPEVYQFENNATRDAKFEEVQKCIISMSAGSAKAKAELTGIIASLGEISGTKSTSTSKRTLSGSAMSAICSVSRTRGRIDRSSGTDKSGDMDMSTCFDGLKGFHLEPNRTFFATVKTLPSPQTYEFPGVNVSMKRMEGKTYKFKYYYAKDGIHYFKSVRPCWMWSEKWITPAAIKATVKTLPRNVGQTFTMDNGALLVYNRRYAGKELPLTLCTCGCGAYKYNTSYFAPHWLEVKHE